MVASGGRRSLPSKGSEQATCNHVHDREQLPHAASRPGNLVRGVSRCSMNACRTEVIVQPSLDVIPPNRLKAAMGEAEEMQNGGQNTCCPIQLCAGCPVSQGVSAKYPEPRFH
jgi:hypothetical protein